MGHSHGVALWRTLARNIGTIRALVYALILMWLEKVGETWHFTRKLSPSVMLNKFLRDVYCALLACFDIPTWWFQTKESWTGILWERKAYKKYTFPISQLLYSIHVRGLNELD